MTFVVLVVSVVLGLVAAYLIGRNDGYNVNRAAYIELERDLRATLNKINQMEEDERQKRIRDSVYVKAHSTNYRV